MTRLLLLSPQPADALLSVGAFLASLAPGRARVLLPDDRATRAYDQLGATSVVLDDSAETWPSALDEELAQADVSAVLLPSGLDGADPTQQVISLCRARAAGHPHLRWVQWYDQPQVGHYRGKYPELAFARRIRGLAEVDDDAGTLNWKPASTPAPVDPLARKLDACLALPPTLIDELFFRSQDFDMPRDPADTRAHLARVLGQREWLQSL